MEIVLITNEFDTNEYPSLINLPTAKYNFVHTDINKNLSLFQAVSKDSKIIAIANPAVIDWECKKNFIETVGNVKGVCTKSSWKEYIDLEYCKIHNIPVLNNVGINSQSVAENAIWQMFTLARKFQLQSADNFIAKPDTIHENIELDKKTAGIIGLGHIGSRIAKMCQGLGMNVVYWSKKTRNKDFKYSNLDNLLKSADVIFNCVETKTETMGLLNKDKLQLIKITSLFVSVIGGCGYDVEDDDYLINSVINGKLGGFSIENKHNKLYPMPYIPKDANIFMPAGYAYFTKEANDRALENFIKNIKSLI